MDIMEPQGIVKEPITNKFKMTFVYIPPGTFMMGSPKSEKKLYELDDKELYDGDAELYKRGLLSNDEVRHEVTLTKGFYMQTTPVTQGQWKAITGDNPSEFKDCGDYCPVENVSWNDAQAFIEKLNLMEGLLEGKEVYRLPTEAEWEYACRAGSEGAFCFGDDDDESKLVDYAWYRSNDSTHPVAEKKPNVWGLYDMHGNVWEWVEDWYDKYPSVSVTDPAGPDRGDYRVVRGGSLYDRAHDCRCAKRSSETPTDRRYTNVGFRLLISYPIDKKSRVRIMDQNCPVCKVGTLEAALTHEPSKMNFIGR